MVTLILNLSGAVAQCGKDGLRLICKGWVLCHVAI